MLLHDVARNRDMPNLVLLDKKETIKSIQDDAESTYSKFEPLLQLSLIHISEPTRPY